MSRVVATFGDEKINQVSNTEFTLESETIFLHPKYWNIEDGQAYNTDYCLIKFQDDIIDRGQDNVRIACLPDKDPVGGEACWIAGWGATTPEGIDQSNQLQECFSTFYQTFQENSLNKTFYLRLKFLSKNFKVGWSEHFLPRLLPC